MGIEEGIKLADQLHRERLLREDRKRRAEEEKIKRTGKSTKKARCPLLNTKRLCRMTLSGRTMARDDAVARQRANDLAGRIGGSAGLTLSKKAEGSSGPGIGALEYRGEGIMTPKLTEEERGRNREDLRASQLSTRPADAPSDIVAAVRYGVASKELIGGLRTKVEG